MNISTGGPHILLFERDQQLAVLLTSEFQLAGYECHTARTAVEVFDAIARHPIKIVLVNVAQAAAARREFWVALDSQRRGRGVQVLTLRCMNLAGYGPHDAEDRSQAMVDVEIDGMLGIVNLIDTVRTRIPGTGIKANTGTMPRMSRMITPTPPTQMSSTPSAIARAASQYSPSLNALFNSNAGSSIARPSTNDAFSSTSSRPLSPVQPPPSAPTAPTHISSTMPTSPLADAQSEVMSSNTSTYTDKIRAVLYPNQRVWTPQNNGAVSAPENRATYEPPTTHTPSQPPMNSAPAEATTLQRLANGQIGTEGQQESGLAQLSRMLQERQLQQVTDYPTRNSYSYQELQQTEEPSFSIPTTMQGPTNTGFINYAAQARPAPAPETPVMPMNYAAPAPVRPAPEAPAAPISYAPPAPARPAYNPEATTGANGSGNYMPPAPVRHTPAPEHTPISAQPLRASPIQDIPAERPVSGHTGTEGTRRTETIARAPYGQSQQTPAAIPPLASIAAQPAPTSPQVKPAPTPPPINEIIEGKQTYITEEPEEETLHHISGELVSNEKGKNKGTVADTAASEEALLISQLGAEVDLGLSPNNALLLDIMQSLPPMPPASQQPSQVQPQVLNGRATRTLNSVLLEGHLVPQNRLEVAQRIQRMLRGVDLNYQLGEILLMFKLLTPDQLLAASLVSYGMITTAQISALGRIRQELHAIGLEYDLENLLILFRILTPEQLREVRSSWQG